MTQETTPALQEVEGGISEEAAAAEILKRMGASETPAEAQEPEQTQEEQPEGDAPAEEEPEQPEAEESEEVEIDVAGEKFKVPAALKDQAERIQAKAKEVEAGATRKFQEAADLRKLAEAQTEHAKQIAQLSQAEVDHISDLRTIDRRLQQILSIDTAALYEQDPAQLARLTAEAQQLQFARQRVEQGLSQAREQSKQKAGEVEQARMAHLSEWSKKNIPGWSDDYSQTLLEFSVKELGADPNTLRSVMSEPVLKALHLAYKGWKVQSTDPKAKQVTATKTLKPGATGQTKSSAQQAVETANRRFGQTHKVDDAAAAILARMKAKRA